MQLNAVVLPAPLGPMSPTISNSLTWRLRSSSACRPPKRIDRSRTSSTDIGALHRGRAGVRGVHRERLAGQPARERPDLLTDATGIQREGEQQPEGADELRRELLRVRRA